MRGLLVVAITELAGCVFYLDPQCDDRIRNGDESDVDCGGTCGPCEAGHVCTKDHDCDSEACVGGTCSATACENGLLDDGETDVDCGGPRCRRCVGGRHCETDSDCSGACIVASKTCYGLTTIAFADAAFYPAGSKAYALETGDLDGDGDLDLAVANELDSAITLLRNDGVRSGTFSPIVGTGDTGFPTGVYPTATVLADFNLDQILDVATADRSGNSVSILLGWGVGATYTLTARYSFPTVERGHTSSVAVGDLNHDGIPDLVATNPLASSVSILIGRGDGTMLPARQISVGIANVSEPYSAALGDFDLDGTLDAAVADNRTTRIFILRGHGDGNFTQLHAQPMIGGAASYKLVAQDMDLDGVPDLVCTNRGSDTVSVLLGRGDGTFRDARVSTTGEGTGPYSLAIADFNRDGAPDVVTANYKTSSASVLLGLGDGRFDPPIDSGPTGTTSYGVTTGDFDGDGLVDFAIANARSNDVAVKLSRSR